MDTLNIASLNINGISKKIHHIIKFFKENKIHILALQETHRCINKHVETLDQFNLKLFRNTPSFEDPVYTGTAFIVDKNLTIEMEDSPLIKNRAQILKIKDDALSYETISIYNIYAPQGVSAEKTRFFETIYAELNSTTGPIILLGDFNNTLKVIDNKNKINTSTADKKILIKALSEHQLSDLFREFHPLEKVFTKESRNYGTRIDRIYGSESILRQTKDAFHIHISFSDHKNCPVIKMKTKENKQTIRKKCDPRKGIWKLNISLLKEKEYNKLIIDIISKSFKYKLEYQDPLKRWDYFKSKVKKATISYAIEKVKNKRKVINEYEQKLHPTDNLEEHLCKIVEEKERLQYEIDKLYLSSKHGARIRAQIPHIEQSEKPTKEFFKAEQAKQSKNKLQNLKLPNGNITNDPDEMSKVVKDHYDNLWASQSVTDHQLLNATLRNLEYHTSNYNEQIYKQKSLIQSSDLHDALKTTKNEKSPGLDGIPYEFYKTFWNLLKYPFTEVVNNIYLCGELTLSMKSALVTLIPKKGNLSEIKNWRPVSLLNTDYKILSKTLASKLKNTLTSRISEEQKCGVPGRRMEEIHLNIAAVLSDSLRKKKAVIIMAIDQAKAFDKVSQDFLFKSMEALKVDKTLISWTKILYNKCQSQIQINKELITQPIPIRSGIRQGCPLSMLLYIIGAEILNKMIKQHKNITAYKIGSEKITLQQYADDTSFILNTPNQIEYIYEVLQKYELISGLCINKEKTEALIINDEDKNYIRDKYPEIKITDNIKLLGIHFNKDMKPMSWDSVIYHIKSILRDHENRKISIIGKNIIVNSLIVPHILKIARVYLIPNHIKKKLDNIIYSFLWKPYSSEQIKRTALQSKKSEGGIQSISSQSIEMAALLERLIIVARKTENGISDLWIKHAKGEMGIKIKAIDEALYSNTEIHYKNPDKIYSYILKYLKEIPTKFDWSNSSFAELRSIVMPKQTDTSKINSKNLSVLNSSKYYNNQEREMALRLIHNGFLWGDWRRRVGFTGSKKSKCNFCRSTADNISHIFNTCIAISPIWGELDKVINSYTGKENEINANMTHLFETKDALNNPVVLKLISTTRTEILLKKEYLELSDKYVQNLDITVPEIMYKIRSKMKIFTQKYYKETKVVSECYGHNIKALTDWFNTNPK